MSRIIRTLLALFLAAQPAFAAGGRNSDRTHGAGRVEDHATVTQGADVPDASTLDLSLNEAPSLDAGTGDLALVSPIATTLVDTSNHAAELTVTASAASKSHVGTPAGNRSSSPAVPEASIAEGAAAARERLADPSVQSVAHASAADIPDNLREFYDGVRIPGGTLKVVEGGPFYRLRYTPDQAMPRLQRGSTDGRTPVYILFGSGKRHYGRPWVYDKVLKAVEEARKYPGYENLELWLVEHEDGVPAHATNVINADVADVRPENMDVVIPRILKKLKDENAVAVAASSALDNYLLWGPTLQEAVQKENNPDIRVNPLAVVANAIRKGNVRTKINELAPEHGWPAKLLGPLSDPDIEDQAVAAFKELMKDPRGLPEVVLKLEISAGKAMNRTKGIDSPEAVRAAIRDLKEEERWWAQQPLSVLPPSPILAEKPRLLIEKKIDAYFGMEYDVDQAASHQDGYVDITAHTIGNPVGGKVDQEKGYVLPAMLSTKIELEFIFAKVAAWIAAWHPHIPFGSMHAEGMSSGDPVHPKGVLLELNPLRVIGGSGALLIEEWSGVSPITLHVFANLGLPLPLPVKQPTDTLVGLAMLPAHTGFVEEVKAPAGVSIGGPGTPLPRVFGLASKGKDVYASDTKGYADTYLGGVVTRAPVAEAAVEQAMSIIAGVEVKIKDGDRMLEQTGDAFYTRNDFPRLPATEMKPGEVRLLPDGKGPHVFHFLYKPRKEGFIDETGGLPPAEFLKGKTPVYLQLGSGYMKDSPMPDLDALIQETRELQGEVPGLKLVVADIEGNRPPESADYSFVEAPLYGMIRDEAKIHEAAEKIIQQVEAQGGVIVGVGTVFNRLIQFEPIIQRMVRDSGMNPYIPVNSFEGLLNTQDKATYRKKIAENAPWMAMSSVQLSYPAEFDAVVAAMKADVAAGLVPAGKNDPVSRRKRDAWWHEKALPILAPMIERNKAVIGDMIAKNPGRNFMMKLTTSMGKNGIWGDIAPTQEVGIEAYLKILQFVFELNFNRDEKGRLGALVPERPNVVFEPMIELDPGNPSMKGRGEGDSEKIIRRLPGGVLEVMAFPMGNPLSVPGAKTELGFTVPAMLNNKLSLEAVVSSLEALLASFYPHLPFGNDHGEWLFDGTRGTFVPIENNPLRPMGGNWSLQEIQEWSGINLDGAGMRANMGLPFKPIAGQPDRGFATRKVASPISGILRDVIIPDEVRALPYLRLRYPSPIDASENNRANWPEIFDLRTGQNRAGPVFIEVWSDPGQPVEQADARAREIMKQIKLVVRTDRDDPATERIVPADMDLYPDDGEVRLPLKQTP